MSLRVLGNTVRCAAQDVQRLMQACPLPAQQRGDPGEVGLEQFGLGRDGRVRVFQGAGDILLHPLEQAQIGQGHGPGVGASCGLVQGGGRLAQSALPQPGPAFLEQAPGGLGIRRLREEVKNPTVCILPHPP